MSQIETDTLSPDRQTKNADCVPTPAEVPHERQQFKALVLANPNYFGNLELSPYKPIKFLQGDTSFEEVICTGLNPPYDRLEAIIRIKRPNGYSRNATSASPGSFEYVRSLRGSPRQRHLARRWAGERPGSRHPGRQAAMLRGLSRLPVVPQAVFV